MSVIGKWDTKELEEWLDKLKEISEDDIKVFHEDAVKEIAARALAKIIAATPLGEYGTKQVEFTTKDGKEVSFTAHSNKVGGTLRRGWTAGEEMDAYSFIMNNTDVIKKGNTYTIIISNNVFYAPYVEYGHRKVNGDWLDGKFMMKISMDEMQDELPAILEEKLNDFLGGYFE